MIILQDEEEVDNFMREIFGDVGGYEEMEDQDRGNEEENIGDDENNLWNDILYVCMFLNFNYISLKSNFKMNYL